MAFLSRLRQPKQRRLEPLPMPPRPLGGFQPPAAPAAPPPAAPPQAAPPQAAPAYDMKRELADARADMQQGLRFGGTSADGRPLPSLRQGPARRFVGEPPPATPTPLGPGAVALTNAPPTDEQAAFLDEQDVVPGRLLKPGQASYYIPPSTQDAASARARTGRFDQASSNDVRRLLGVRAGTDAMPNTAAQNELLARGNERAQRGFYGRQYRPYSNARGLEVANEQADLAAARQAQVERAKLPPPPEIFKDDDGNVLGGSPGVVFPPAPAPDDFGIRTEEVPVLDKDGNPLKDNSGRTVTEKVQVPYNKRTGADYQAPTPPRTAADIAAELGQLERDYPERSRMNPARWFGAGRVGKDSDYAAKKAQLEAELQGMRPAQAPGGEAPSEDPTAMTAEQKRAAIRRANPGKSDDELAPMFRQYGA